MGIFSAENAINSFGLIGIFTILFVETGLPIVLGLPGDSLLFLAGVAASGTGAKLNVQLSLWPLVIGAPLFASAENSKTINMLSKHGTTNVIIR